MPYSFVLHSIQHIILQWVSLELWLGLQDKWLQAVSNLLVPSRHINARHFSKLFASLWMVSLFGEFTSGNCVLNCLTTSLQDCFHIIIVHKYPMLYCEHRSRQNNYELRLMPGFSNVKYQFYSNIDRLTAVLALHERKIAHPFDKRLLT